MKKILILIFTVGLLSCNSHLDKPIFEPLTVNELKKSIDNDSLFKGTYKYITFIRDSVLTDDMEKVKFAELTYEQIFDYVKFSNDTTYFKPINERLETEWNKKFGIYENKVDSISNYWKKYKEENSLEQYVAVELARIDKEYYSYSNGIRDINLGFRLTPLKGKIEQIRFGYRIEAKINEKENDDSYSSIYSALDKSWCLTTSPFTKPVVRYWEVNYTNEKVLKSKTLETLKRDYNIYIEIDEIRVNGKNLSNDDLNIPKSVSRYWEYENREYLKDLYVDDVIKEILGVEYLDKYEYPSQGIDKIMKEKDPLVFEFYNSPYEKDMLLPEFY